MIFCAAADHTEWESLQWESSAESILQLCHLWSWLGGDLMWAEVGHQVCQFWDQLGETLVHAKVSYHLCPAWGHLGYEMVWSWLLLVLDLKTLGRIYAVNQGKLPLVLGLDPLWTSQCGLRAAATCVRIVATELKLHIKIGLATAYARLRATCWGYDAS